jgi:hypothetical protein
MPGVTTVIADVAELAHEACQLPDALDELAVRCDLIGAGPLLDTWARKRSKRQRARRRWLARRGP